MKAEVIISHNGAKLILNEEGQQEVIHLAAEKLAGKLAEEEFRNRVYTIPQLAKRLECCRATVDNLINEGKIKLGPTLGKSKGYRVAEMEVRRFLGIAR
ncbi:helix-turn-helix domain-containing protein [Rufibacter glacialis]|uniref:Helix-turn-helix domain-containing protein n=1 Tax=Rufibacter glacialis TaxID=1259555 RepID=A0A5M8QMY3_9BACT|nr:helix-turn-helix domain-containing protein [Rufibacter glacialis]KAA6437495.1 helix-turn-helix domain-containing protein [Rufibacter glacialis]GGK58898.1 hypothetical protein GCM10011405_03660 [Rufibacter glacialis]